MSERYPDDVSAGAVAVVAGAAAVVGLMLPDVDLWLGLDHRSGLTHGLLLPLLIALAGRARPALLVVAAGLALGIGVHCAADLFPRSMRGWATIHLPWAGSIGPGWSYAWLAATVLAGIVVPLRMVGRRFGNVALSVAVGATFMLAVAYLVLHREPLATVAAVGGALAVAHPAGRRRVLARLHREP